MESYTKLVRKRVLIFRTLLVITFAGLLSRFFYVQIIEWDKYRQASNQNRIRAVTDAAPRGLILDRYGEILVDNIPAFSVFAIPYELDRGDGTLGRLSDILDTPVEILKRRYARERRGPFQRVKLVRYVEFGTLAQLEEMKMDLPGIEIDVEPRRYYPSGVRAPHVFGYLGEISEEELKQLAKEGYERGDVIGKKGLEKVYERELRGEKGIYYIEVDALGRTVRTLTGWGEKKPVPGKTLYLGIDAELQRFLENAMADRRGGAVVLNCKNGEVIAMVSKPDFDPDLFARPISPEDWEALVNDPGHPLYDRMVQSVYPPGSTYKLILAIAGLESGLIRPEETVYCPGYLRLGVRTFDCWNPAGHGNVNLLEAIEQSCNVYFYRMIQRVGLQLWVNYSRLFRFGKRTGIDLIGESAGLVPDSTYFNTRYGAGKWSRGLLLNLSVGQGDLLVTPLQMAVFALTVANRGLGFRPHLARYFEDPLTGEQRYVEPDTFRVSGIRETTWDLIHEGMFRVVNGARGTAKAANPGRIVVAGKTGTAENPHGEPHAWFIGFAPMQDPQVAWAIFIENGGSGGAQAAPIARGILRLLLRKGKIQVPEKAAIHAD